jgi:hypothetical protein
MSAPSTTSMTTVYRWPGTLAESTNGSANAQGKVPTINPNDIAGEEPYGMKQPLSNMYEVGDAYLHNTAPYDTS